MSAANQHRGVAGGYSGGTRQSQRQLEVSVRVPAGVEDSAKTETVSMMPKAVLQGTQEELKVKENNTEQLEVVVDSTQPKKNSKEGVQARSTWSAIVQKKQELKKFDVEIEEIYGVQTIRIPDDVFEDSPPLWDDFLIEFFFINGSASSKDTHDR